jgi:hypothetical protein
MAAEREAVLDLWAWGDWHIVRATKNTRADVTLGTRMEGEAHTGLLMKRTARVWMTGHQVMVVAIKRKTQTFHLSTVMVIGAHST